MDILVLIGILPLVSERNAEFLHNEVPGITLPDEVRRRLFEPHVTTRAGGSGMGLYLAHQLIVTMHGGTLEVGTAPGGGTEAVVGLPLMPAEEAGA